MIWNLWHITIISSTRELLKPVLDKYHQDRAVGEESCTHTHSIALVALGPNA